MGTRRIASAASETQATAPGVPPGATQGGLEPGGGGDLLGGPQLRRGEGQPAARGERAAALLQVAPEPGGEREKGDPPLVEELPNKEGGFNAGEAAGRERVPGGHTPGLREKSAGRLHAGEAPQGAKSGVEDEESQGPNHQTPLGMDPACAVPVGHSAGGGSPGAQGELHRRRSVCL